jgi:zinc transport system permease protein
MTDALKAALQRTADILPAGFWLAEYSVLKGLLAVLLVGLICGAVGSLVVGNRMAFFSDALAHCAFAGVALGLLLSLATGAAAAEGEWLVPTIMVVFGAVVGLLIAFVRERTALANDTVIGVFFAGAVGFGGMLLATIRTRSYLSPETFLFGSPLFVTEGDLLALMALAVTVALVLIQFHNPFVLASFNPSLARTRHVRVVFCNYLFIVVLALIVNLSIKAVGALLINALLVVPAATAANVGRNLRQMFWGSIGLALLAGVAGMWLSIVVEIPVGRGEPLRFGPGGTIVVLSVLFFFGSMAWKAAVAARGPRGEPQGGLAA